MVKIEMFCPSKSHEGTHSNDPEKASREMQSSTHGMVVWICTGLFPWVLGHLNDLAEKLCYLHTVIPCTFKGTSFLTKISWSRSGTKRTATSQTIKQFSVYQKDQKSSDDVGLAS